MASAFRTLSVKPSITTIVEFPIDTAHIKNVDVAIVCCIDPRWWRLYQHNGNFVSSIQALLNTKGWKTNVPLTEAGGIKVLVSGDPADRERCETLLARIEQEIGLHHPRILAVSVHRDCGAYGYAAVFDNDEARENERLYGDLWRAKEILDARFGARVTIEFYIFDAKRVEQVLF